MSEVVGLDGKPKDHRTLDMDAADAREALGALLQKIDAGEIQVLNWLFVFDSPGATPGTVQRQTLDSGLTIEKAVFLIEDVKHTWFQMMRSSP